MGRLIGVENLEEGIIFNKWLDNRFKNNKNVLGATTGPTGSAKSYQDLRKAELWYKYKFNEPFPTRNICFGVSEIMMLIQEGKLRKGEVIIFEESGVNLGSLDFQNRVSKIFTYILQSFRSMNIGIFFNLPYLSMLNKSARMLVHYHFVTAGIDHKNQVSICQPFFLQINQSSGKVYSKYPRVNYKGRVKTVKRFAWKKPDASLINAYEKKKLKFLTEITDEYTAELKKIEEDKLKKMGRPELTDKQKRIYELACQGYQGIQIAKIEGISPQAVSDSLKHSKKKGYLVGITQKRLENKENQGLKPISAPI